MVAFHHLGNASNSSLDGKIYSNESKEIFGSGVSSNRQLQAEWWRLFDEKSIGRESTEVLHHLIHLGIMQHNFKWSHDPQTGLRFNSRASIVILFASLKISILARGFPCWINWVWLMRTFLLSEVIVKFKVRVLHISKVKRTWKHWSPKTLNPVQYWNATSF